MNLVDALKLSKQLDGGGEDEIFLLSSSNVEPLLPFIKAYSFLRGDKVEVITAPFGTLEQSLYSVNLSKYNHKVALIFPWDLLPFFDWRTGVKSSDENLDVLCQKAIKQISNIDSKFCNLVIYIDAPVAPTFFNINDENIFLNRIKATMAEFSWTIFDASFFNLGGYLDYGAAISPLKLSDLAYSLVSLVYRSAVKKVLITDCDNVLWNGVLSEDGADGVCMDQNGKGYKHYIYQTLIAKLKYEGILLAAVSRNSTEVLEQGLAMGGMCVNKEDFVATFATYDKKSECIYRLSKLLNLGLDSFVFVDDNPLEIEEVKKTYPEVTTLFFSKEDAEYLKLINMLKELFQKNIITTEDRNRTSLYKQLMVNNITINATKTNNDIDIDEYLSSINMTLSIKEHFIDTSERPLQLINKTNQFNANGLRISQNELASILSNGGRLFVGKLSDNGGDHGEIIVGLIDDQDVLIRLVMSCRVFMRKIEFVFLQHLYSILKAPISVLFFKTNRNEPFCKFLEELKLPTSYKINNDESTIIKINNFDQAIKGIGRLDFIQVTYS